MRTMDRPSLAVRIAAPLFIAEAGFGIAMPFTVAHIGRTGELPMTQFRSRSFSGPFEAPGFDAFIVGSWQRFR
jgi:hypothetical protein